MTYEPKIEVVLSFISRGNYRGGYQWSTKSCREGLGKLGYPIQPRYEGHTLVQCVRMCGTRDQIITHRRTIMRYLRGVGGNKIATTFYVVT